MSACNAFPLLFGIGFTAALTAATGQRPPNVLFIAIDDLRNDLGSMGVVHAKTPPAEKAGAPKKKADIGLKFRVQQLHVDNNEGCAIADFNRDDKLDVSAGEHWYPGPTFTEKKPLRKLLPFGRDYLTNNGEHAYDVNGDGFPDIITGSFMDTGYRGRRQERHAYPLE